MENKLLIKTEGNVGLDLIKEDYKRRFYREGFIQASKLGFINFNLIRAKFSKVDFTSNHISDLIDELVKGFENGMQKKEDS